LAQANHVQLLLACRHRTLSRAMLPRAASAVLALLVRCSCDADTLSLIQTSAQLARLSLETESCGRLVSNVPGDTEKMMNNNAKYHTHKADFYRPIPEVMAEHPSVDGYCYFNASAIYIYYQYGERDYVQNSAAGILGLMSPLYRGLNSGPKVTYHWEGDTVTTHLDSMNYVYDDLYGYSLGFLQGQGIDTALMSNSTAWEALSAEKCEQIQQQYQFSNDELILNDLLDINMPIMAMCYCAAGAPLPLLLSSPYVTKLAEYHSPRNCKKITQREFARHHYMKCALGHKNSADDMAYLHSRACLLDGGRIGHYSECPYSPAGIPE